MKVETLDNFNWFPILPMDSFNFSIYLRQIERKTHLRAENTFPYWIFNAFVDGVKEIWDEKKKTAVNGISNSISLPLKLNPIKLF